MFYVVYIYNFTVFYSSMNGILDLALVHEIAFSFCGNAGVFK